MTTIQSVVRAVQILDLIAQEPEPLTVRSIASRLNLNVSTAHHLVRTLAQEDYVYQLPAGTYCLSHAIPRLYQSYQRNFHVDDGLMGILRDVARQSRETAYISSWHNGDAVIESIIEGPQAVRVTGMHVGYYGFAHARAGSKVLLAYLDGPAREAYLATHALDRLTNNTLTNREALTAHLALIAEQGIAFDREEFSQGVYCVAAPIFAANGEIAYSLSVSAPDSRFKEREAELVRIVMEAAAEASTLLGYRHQPQQGLT
jgi:IclR family acetate operon transcriptional repressor